MWTEQRGAKDFDVWTNLKKKIDLLLLFFSKNSTFLENGAKVSIKTNSSRFLKKYLFIVFSSRGPWLSGLSFPCLSNQLHVSEVVTILFKKNSFFESKRPNSHDRTKCLSQWELHQLVGFLPDLSLLSLFRPGRSARHPFSIFSKLEKHLLEGLD